MLDVGPTKPTASRITVQSDPTFDGVYVPTILVDDRLVLTLDRDTALSYVAAWSDAVARAEFDAAVFAQLTGIGVPDRDAAAVVVKNLRPDRPPLDADATAPLRLEPILSTRTRRGMVEAYLRDELVLRLDAPAVYDHLVHVLPVVMTCDLDAAYRRFAVGWLEQPESMASAMVADLGVRWRVPEQQGAEHDRWIREQFAGIVSLADPPPLAGEVRGRQPWTAGRRRTRKKRRR